ncbi:hypothetical protein GCM10022415_23690 [Knoellia locipacati]|uniref:Uncharacterized protein n=1 Tax=Knoellia locipacati TaxID=882824 RepID=A0A512T288_9MICO|nr:hypothetical protein [Knoellia locipacati]GEQ14318.1 hypothetical protein KLO01_23650 [Knoellia locipacati]
MNGLRALWCSVALIATMASCGTAGPGTESAGSGSATPAVTVTAPGSGGTTSTPATPTSTETPVIKVTDDVFAGLTRAQAEKIRDRCHGSLSVPGTDDICVIPKTLPPCTPQNRWCVRIATVAGTDLRAVQVQDRSPDRQLCGTARARCPLLVVTRQVTNDVHVTKPKTTHTATPTTSTGGATVKPKPTVTPSPTAPSTTKSPRPTATFKPSAGPGPTPPPAATVAP